MKAKSRLKLKRDNDTPEKMSDDSRSIIDVESIHKVNESLEELKITDEILKKFYTSSNYDNEYSNNMSSIAVRYELPPEKQKPLTKKICVLKKAPMNVAAVPSSALLEQMSLRIDDHQRPVQHSILGSLDDFFKMSLTKKAITMKEIPVQFHHQLDQNSSIRHMSSLLPISKDINDKDHPVSERILDSCRTTMDPDTKALKMWEKRMMERRNLQNHISKKVHRLPESLIFNSGEEFRKKLENDYLISKTIPYYGAGYGFRTGSEFWKQNEIVGDNEDRQLHMSTTQAEKGYPPSILHVGVSNRIKEEKGVPINTLKGIKKYSEYEKGRCEELQEVMNELDPHFPDIENLVITGSPFKYGGNGDEVRDQNNLSESYNDYPNNDSFASQAFSRPDTVSEGLYSSSTGPCLVINSVKLPTIHNDYDPSPLEIRVIFNDYTKNKCLEKIHFHNKGSSIIRFWWKKLEFYDPFQLENKDIRRFYFNTQDGILLPNQEIYFPVIFKSDKSGIFLERWKLETLPTVARGRDIVISLKGIALQRDVHGITRKKIENYLNDQVAGGIVGGILDDILESMFHKVPDISKNEEYVHSEEENFCLCNNTILYDMDNVSSLKKLYGELGSKEGVPDQEWNLSCQQLKNDIYSNEVLKGVKKEETCSKFYRYMDKLMTPSFRGDTSRRDHLYRIAYRTLLDFSGDMFTSLGYLRKNHDLPEMELRIMRDKKGSNLSRQKTNNSQTSKASTKKQNENKMSVSTSKMKSKESTILIREPTEGLLTEIDETDKVASRSASDVDEPATDNELSESNQSNPNISKYGTKAYQTVYALLNDSIDSIITLWTDLLQENLS